MGRVKPTALSKTSRWVRNAVAAQLAKAAWLWLSPLVGGVAGVTGVVSGLSPAEVIQTIVVCAAMVALALNQGRAFWVASSAQGKFNLQTITTELRINPTTWDTVGYRLTFWFTNVADFVIEFEIHDVRATIENQTLDLGQPKNDIHRIEPRSTWFYDYGVIPYAPADGEIKTPIAGTALITFDYGKPGKAGFKETQSFRLVVDLDAVDGQVIRTNAYRHHFGE